MVVAFKSEVHCLEWHDLRAVHVRVVNGHLNAAPSALMIVGRLKAEEIVARRDIQWERLDVRQRIRLVHAAVCQHEMIRNWQQRLLAGLRLCSWQRRLGRELES